jgi:hypothetical protein
MTLSHAYASLPARARAVLCRYAVRRWLRADPTWKPRRHVMAGLVGEELTAAREADARQRLSLARARQIDVGQADPMIRKPRRVVASDHKAVSPGDVGSVLGARAGVGGADS